MMRCSLIVTMLLIGLPGAVKAVDTGPKANVVPIRESQPAYWREARLETAVAFPEKRQTLPRGEGVFTQPLTERESLGNRDASPRVIRLVAGRVLEAKLVLRAIREKTGITLLLAGEWGRQSLAVPQAPTPARELMDGMALVCGEGARWFPNGKDGWVLARGQNEAEWASLPDEKRYTEIRANAHTLLGALSGGPGQWRALARGERLTLQMLTPAQREVVFQQLRLYYYEQNPASSNSPSAAALEGKGVELSFSGAGKDATLILHADGWPARFFCGVPFYNDDGTLAFGVAPPR